MFKKLGANKRTSRRPYHRGGEIIELREGKSEAGKVKCSLAFYLSRFRLKLKPLTSSPTNRFQPTAFAKAFNNFFRAF